MDIFEVTEADRARAKEELNEPDDPSDAIGELRESVKAAAWFSPVFEPRLDDQYVLRFLRVSKFDQATALGRLESMFALQKEWHELFGEFTFASIEPLLKSGLAQVMSKRDKDGCIVLSMTAAKWDPSKFPIHVVYRNIMFIEEVLLLGDPVQISGIKLLGNFDGLQLKHVRAMERRALKLWGQATGKTIPLRMKKICMINFPMIMNVVMNFMKLFLPSKIKERMAFVGSDHAKIKHYFGDDVIPTKLGGLAVEDADAMVELIRSRSAEVEEKYAYLKSWVEMKQVEQTPLDLDQPETDL